MPLSEAHNDTRTLVRLAFPAFTGHLGMVAPHGATFQDGVAQNGVTEQAAERLIGCIGPALSIVGPWEDPSAPTGRSAVAPPAGAPPAPSRTAKPPRRP